jgi:hypothetical protein
MRAAALAGGAVSVFIVGADVLMAELAIGLPLSSEHSYHGTDFTTPKRTSRAAANASRTAQVSRETRRNGDGLVMKEYSCGACCIKEFQRETERLATTTGGEPVHDACGRRRGRVHGIEVSIAIKRMQGTEIHRIHIIVTILLRLRFRISPGNAEFYPQTELSSPNSS